MTRLRVGMLSTRRAEQQRIIDICAQDLMYHIMNEEVLVSQTCIAKCSKAAIFGFCSRSSFLKSHLPRIFLECIEVTSVTSRCAR
jgi:hypothetical protein